MSTKVCTGCKKRKPLTAFHWRSKKEGKRIARCRLCASEWSKNHYRDNKKMYVKKARVWNAKNQDVVRKVVMDHLQSHPCVDCGEADPIVLTFDHVRGRKSASVSELMGGGGCSPDRVLKEIKKCDVRCANCHARRTAKQLGSWRLLRR